MAVMDSTEEMWEAIKLANIRGVGDPALSEEFGVTREAIRQRRFRDRSWQAAVTPVSSLKSEERKGEASQTVTEGSKTASLAQKVASTVSGSIATLSENNLLLASRIAQRGLQRANSEFDAIPIENMGDVERIFKMAAMAGKWNAPQVEIKQAFAFGGGKDDENVMECDSLVIEDSSAYDDGFETA